MTDKTRATCRRVVLKAGLGGVLAAAATQVRLARAQEKIDQQLVMYQTQPKDGQECDACVNWEPPNSCKVVNGVISPKGWCAAFAPKGS